MKLVIRTVLFHILCIIVFAIVYYNLSTEFHSIDPSHNKKFNNFLDCILLSTTIQAGVGISDLYPLTYFSKIALIIQQIFLILTHVITIYIFTL